MMRRKRSNLKMEQTSSNTEDHAARDRRVNRETSNLGFTPEL
jgi:hypothetical protein